MEGIPNNKNLLSNIFKNYQELDLHQKEIINRNTLSYNKDVNKNKYKNTILDDLNINKNDIFSKKVIDKLEIIKNNTLKKYESLIDKFKLCYEEYKKKILDYINQKESNISKLNFENLNNKTLIKYSVYNIFNNIIDTNEVYEYIIKNIESNFLFLNDYLKKTELICVKNTKEYFLNKNYKDIINCSLLSKFNFKEIDTTSLSKISYYNYYLNFLKEEKNVGLIRTFTIKHEEMKKGEQFIKEHFSNLQNLHIHGIDTEGLKKIIKTISEHQNRINGYILKKITIEDFNFSEIIDKDKLNEIRLNKIERIKISSGQCLNPIFLSELLLRRTESLTSLSLEKINMTNYGLNALMNIFINNPVFLDTLEYISLAGNCISLVKKDIFEPEEMFDKKFTQLKIFNLHKNNIYKFEISLEKMPELKILDLSGNSILTASMMEIMMKRKNTLVLFNDNIFISNNSNNSMTYIEYLNRQLPKLDFGLKVLHLGFTYEKDKKDLLNKLKLSPSIKLALIKLDLSFCGLNTDVLINFLKQNYGLFSLKKLNLKYNNLESDIFKKMDCDEITLESLNIIDLSENTIECKTIEENENLIKFIVKNKNLEMIKLMSSNFFESWINLFKQDNAKKLNNLYKDLKKYLKENNRRFMFVIDEDNSSTFNEGEFLDLFSFRFL